MRSRIIRKITICHITDTPEANCTTIFRSSIVNKITICHITSSIFIKENTWWIFGAYLLVSGAVFGVTYWTVRKQFEKEILFLLGECAIKVKNYLEAFKKIAEDFEKNIQASGQYNCLKRQLDEKAAARKQYQEAMRRYAWHKMKVKQLLRNMIFFESFIGDAAPYEEGTVSLESFDNDAEHTEFYQIKVFRR